MWKTGSAGERKGDGREQGKASVLGEEGEGAKEEKEREETVFSHRAVWEPHSVGVGGRAWNRRGRIQ